MDKPSPISTDLLYKHEVLRARLEIRDFFLQNAFREVYENIGQNLSLAQLQLAKRNITVDKERDDPVEPASDPIEATSDPMEAASDPIEAASDLVGQSIRDLREMCKGFYPDTEILKAGGFARGIRKITRIIYPGDEYLLRIREVRNEIESGITLIVFNMLLEILTLIKRATGVLISLDLFHSKKTLALQVTYTAEDPVMDNYLGDRETNPELTLRQRASVLGGNLVIVKNKLTLTFPLNQAPS
ncbi:MAG TPA: hypothetical protein VKQ08_10980 [Cyclobacteriaceae bacterium]|nr:hypothetical protein [Cyclobacteriaceae bacterium]